LGVVSDGFVPCKFDTDVNAPAFAEFTLGKQAVSATSCVYITVGTGVGIGVVANSKTVHGLLHPEGGHVHIKRCPPPREAQSPNQATNAQHPLKLKRSYTQPQRLCCELVMCD